MQIIQTGTAAAIEMDIERNSGYARKLHCKYCYQLYILEPGEAGWLCKECKPVFKKG